MDQFLEFFYRIITAGEEQFYYLAIKRDIATHFIDMALGEESPLCWNEKRPKMGSDHANPPFDNLVKTVSFVVRNCSVVVQGGEAEDGPDSPYFLNSFGKSYPLSDEAINMVFHAATFI